MIPIVSVTCIVNKSTAHQKWCVTCIALPVTCIALPALSMRVLLTRNIPDSDAGVERGGDDKILRRMETGAHDVMVVSGQDGHTLAGLPVPEADCLVVTG